jgi:hypothetical protein
MTCNNAIDWSARPSSALDAMTLRCNYRRDVLESLLLYLFTYELPIDKVRAVLGKVENDALAEFYPLKHAGERREFCRELLERLFRVEESTVAKLPAASGKQQARNEVCPECKYDHAREGAGASCLRARRTSDLLREIERRTGDDETRIDIEWQLSRLKDREQQAADLTAASREPRAASSDSAPPSPEEPPT